MLKIFAITIRVIQAVLLLSLLFSFVLTLQESRDSAVIKYWHLSDPYLIPIDTDYNLHTESKALHVELQSNRFSSVRLKPEKIALSLRGANDDMLLRLGLLLLVVAFAALAIIVMEQLRRMIESARKQSPFTRENVWRIYIMASLFLCFPVIQYLLRRLVAYLVEKHIVLHGLEWAISPSYHMSYFLMGALLISIGKIIERGIQIQEEQKFTI